MASQAPTDGPQADIKAVDNKIKGKIFARDPKTHRQYSQFVKKNPIALLEIPKGFILDWQAKIKMQAQAGYSVSTYTDLLNLGLAPSSLFASLNNSIESRLKKESSKIRGAYTSTFGAKKTAFNSSIHNLLLFESEVDFNYTSQPLGQSSNALQLPGRCG